MPFVEVVGNEGALLFLRSGPICVNTGVIEEVTTIFIVVGAAHWPASGVKVYVLVPVAEVFITAGFHDPLMPLFEVPGRGSAVAPTQYGPSWVNVGVTLLVTWTSIVA